VVVVGQDGALTDVDAATGRSSSLTRSGETTIGFPAWSADRKHVAAIRPGANGTDVVVFDAAGARSGTPAEPVVLFRNATVGPFYVSWAPDGKAVSFLADDAGGISLRLAPSDGSAPLDGTGPGSIVRAGNPFYYDWIARDRLLAHIGTGSKAFLGEIGLDGKPVSDALTGPGDFRSAVVSRDRGFEAFVRAKANGRSDVIVAARDGSTERTIPVFGMAAVAFDPVGDTVATIGPTKVPTTQFSIPVGPIRLVDANSGATRTLLDGQVVSFWWSPDGRTIAALRVQAAPKSAASATAGASAGASPSASSTPTEVRLLFVDVASGDVRSESVVRPSQLFIDQFLTFFDQYALSHRLWAPDSSAMLFPVADDATGTHVAVLHVNGDEPDAIPGAIAFWSP